MTTQSETAKVTVFADLAELTAAEGAQLGPTDWLVVDQARVDQFAEATDDHQWIHVDPERAASGPYGGTIAHGLLTLSLLPHFMHDLYRVDDVAMAINYGFNKVRFITPVPTGSRRARPLEAHLGDRGQRGSPGDADDDDRSRGIGQAGSGRRVDRQVRGLT